MTCRISRPPKRMADLDRPRRDVGSVVTEQRQRHALQPEADAAGMTGGPVSEADAPTLAEMVLVVVEGKAGRRLLDARHRDQKLEFQCLVPLAVGQHLAGAPEERIVGDFHVAGQVEVFDDPPAAFHPALLESLHLRGG